ncbi:hypothetical protein GCM10023215_20950 [Pseudonocardia yuanmonensis]|uniref:SGNH hydrolase-type esterase domain-containing protein n=1 Tax=Pseudonocardia yuanmonensis TaxID=1095914 RepID=A0ABP8WAP5_9PSEU
MQSVRPVRALPTPASLPPRTVTTLATLGDSTAVGLGDPLPGGGWRGFPVLLRDALGPGTRLLNPARTGARMADVRHTQLPAVLPARPDAAVICAGMNDTLRSDFDPAGICTDLAATLGGLAAAGTFPVVLRYHDHTRVFRLPGRLRAALRTRVTALNAAIDTAIAETTAGGPDVGVLDLHLLPGGYEREAWSVDRLHPSELGHRLLARAAGELLAGSGYAVPAPVPIACGGGREITALHRAAWIMVRGTPWLVRRGRDLGPVILHGLLTGGRARAPRPPRQDPVRAARGGPGLGGPGEGDRGDDALPRLDLEEVGAGAGPADPADHPVDVVAAPRETADVARRPGAGADGAGVEGAGGDRFAVVHAPGGCTDRVAML